MFGGQGSSKTIAFAQIGHGKLEPVQTEVIHQLPPKVSGPYLCANTVKSVELDS